MHLPLTEAKQMNDPYHQSAFLTAQGEIINAGSDVNSLASMRDGDLRDSALMSRLCLVSATSVRAFESLNARIAYRRDLASIGIPSMWRL